MELTLQNLKLLIITIQNEVSEEEKLKGNGYSTKLLLDKYNRLNTFYTDLCDYIFKLTHTLYFNV